MSVRNRHRQGMTTHMSCPICRNLYGGTPEWEKIPTFPNGRGLTEHIKKKHEVKK